jgi:hypothetical protein
MSLGSGDMQVPAEEADVFSHRVTNREYGVGCSLPLSDPRLAFIDLHLSCHDLLLCMGCQTLCVVGELSVLCNGFEEELAYCPSLLTP